jgi:predicted GIY-YIG superfamily endonuclease
MSEEWGRIGLGVLKAAAADAPREPGVYFFLDEGGDIIYVGKATDLKARLRQHAAAKYSTYRLQQKYDLVRRVRWERTADEEAALWREADLIFALQPPYNGDPDRRADLLGNTPPVPYIVVTEDGSGTLRFTLEPDVPEKGRAYGCFPHLGKGVGSDIGIACSDGYTALLRLVWAASGDGRHTPATITRSAPLSFSVTAPAGLSGNLHRFLSGTRARLVDELLAAAAHRPPFMQPGLRTDRAAALRFFAAGPRSVRAVRLRHRVRDRVIDEMTYRRLVQDEVAPIVQSQD